MCQGWEPAKTTRHQPHCRIGKYGVGEGEGGGVGGKGCYLLMNTGEKYKGQKGMELC